MWGRLVLQEYEGKANQGVPSEIEFDISKKTHFIGRLPTAPEGRFRHRAQHCVPLSFLSATHCSIEINTADENNLQFVLTDFSTNGTFHSKKDCLKSANDATSLSISQLSVSSGIEFVSQLVGTQKSIFIFDKDYVVFRFKGAPPVVYLFEVLTQPVEVNCSLFFPSALSLQQNTIANLENENSLLNRQILQQRDEHSINENRLISHANKVEGLQKEIALKDRQLSGRNEEFENLKNEFDKMIKHTEAVEANYAAIETKNRKLKDSLSDNLETISSLSGKIESNKEEICHLKEKLSSREELVRDLSNSMAEEMKIKKINEKEIESLGAHLCEEKKSTERLANANSLLQSLVNEKDKEIAFLKNELSISKSCQFSPEVMEEFYFKLSSQIENMKNSLECIRPQASNNKLNQNSEKKREREFVTSPILNNSNIINKSSSSKKKDVRISFLKETSVNTITENNIENDEISEKSDLSESKRMRNNLNFENNIEFTQRKSIIESPGINNLFTQVENSKSNNNLNNNTQIENGQSSPIAFNKNNFENNKNNSVKKNEKKSTLRRTNLFGNNNDNNDDNVLNILNENNSVESSPLINPLLINTQNFSQNSFLSFNENESQNDSNYGNNIKTQVEVKTIRKRKQDENNKNEEFTNEGFTNEDNKIVNNEEEDKSVNKNTTDGNNANDENNANIENIENNAISCVSLPPVSLPPKDSFEEPLTSSLELDYSSDHQFQFEKLQQLEKLERQLEQQEQQLQLQEEKLQRQLARNSSLKLVEFGENRVDEEIFETESDDENNDNNDDNENINEDSENMNDYIGFANSDSVAENRENEMLLENICEANERIRSDIENEIIANNFDDNGGTKNENDNSNVSKSSKSNVNNSTPIKQNKIEKKAWSSSKIIPKIKRQSQLNKSFSQGHEEEESKDKTKNNSLLFKPSYIKQ